MSAADRGNLGDLDERMFRSLAEQIKIPLMQISHTAELHRLGKTSNISHIETIADMSLRLIDGYLLSNELTLLQERLELEPVSVSSVLHRAAEKLDKFAREHACNIELKLDGKYGPVMADRTGLESALIALGYSLIESQTKQKPGGARVVLAAYRDKDAIVAGTFGEMDGLSPAILERARYLQGRARQPASDLSHSASAGLFIADSLMKSMQTELKVSKRYNMTGLSARFASTPQLELIGA